LICTCRMPGAMSWSLHVHCSCSQTYSHIEPSKSNGTQVILE